MDKIEGMKEELSGLLQERPALESEMKTVFTAIDSAPHMTPDMREAIHDYYDRKFARVQSNISDMMNQYFKLGGDPDDLL